MIKHLDCTFRDGGYYNKWDFPSSIVNDYLKSMQLINIDYVELGFRSLSQKDFKGPNWYTTDNYINSLKIQIEERSTQYMRIVADFENYRKRTQKEKEELDIQVKHNTITELLSVIDNFERARSQIKPQNDGEMNIHKSYQGVYKLLVDSLKRLGVSSMRSEGQPFDPNIHEAAMRENTNEHPEGTVLEELVRGYYLGDRVLRHAMVKVSVSQEDTTPIQEESQLPEDK